MKKLLLMLVVSVVFLGVGPVWAVKVASLYQADMPVATQSEDERAEAVKAGFLQVLVKISGNPDIDKNPVIKSSLQKADYFVQEFSYSASSPSSSTYSIHIRYDTDDVNKLVKKAGVASWGETRPLLLAWVVVTNNKKTTEIMGSDDQGDVINVMKQQGKKFGLPLIFPVMDVIDMNQVSLDDVVGSKIPVLKEAGKRYAPDGLLIGTLQQTKDGWQSQWQLVLHGHQWHWTIADKTPDNLFANLLNQVSQALSKQLVVKSDSAPQAWLKLEVTNVTQRDDLAQLMQYLEQLAPVQQVQLSQVSGDVVDLAVQVRGSLENFQQNASIGQHLMLKSQNEASNEMLYEWVH